MILKSVIQQVISEQSRWLEKNKNEVTRESVDDIQNTAGFATILTGIRRCGKSTLMHQVMKKYLSKEILFINFDDIRLAGFDSTDFVRLHTIIKENDLKVLFFDEIQLVYGWEIFVHQLLREEYAVYITGSNASMLSVELGTHLTGRHLSSELFPFSYAEYLTYTHQKSGEASFKRYLFEGGMPEYLSAYDHRIPLSLLDDILIRDIAIRRNIRNVEPLKQLAIYLLTNIAKPFSGNRLTSTIGSIATSTVLEYVDYMRDAYIIDTIGQYSTNIRLTVRNPKKVYAIDTGIASNISLSKSEDIGRLLENYQFLLLRKRYKDHIYYYSGRGECDFVVTDINNKPRELYQVCLTLTEENMDREINGLREAMRELSIAEGTIVTLSDTDTFTVAEGTIHIISTYK